MNSLVVPGISRRLDGWLRYSRPWQFFVGTLAGWINEHQQAAIEYLREENRVWIERHSFPAASPARR